MLSSDRNDFEMHLSKLCAGFNVPLSPERTEGYWAGLAKMGLVEFVRCVDASLGEEGSEKIPTPPQIWRIRAKLRARLNHPELPASHIHTQDHIEFFANRMLFRHAVDRAGLGSGTFRTSFGLTGVEASAELLSCVTAKRACVDWYLMPIREGDPDATPKGFVIAFTKALQKCTCLVPSTLAFYRALARHPRAMEPFAPSMARPLLIDEVALT